LNSNFVLPTIMTDVDKDLPEFTNIVMLNDADDCARIARAHVKKAPNFTPILASSVISTTDNTHWRKERESLTTAFMPNSSLSHVFDKSVERARACTAILGQQSEGGAAPVSRG
jgi:hypothetical protein